MKTAISLPSQQSLQKLFTYSVITGCLYWKVSTSNRIKVGDVAGCLNSQGYITVKVDGKTYQAHRLVWKLVTGEDPGDLHVDHLNGDKTHNAWHNLRLATNQQNICNSRRGCRNTSGFKGVTWHKPSQKYQARICIHGRTKSLGHFPTPEEAHQAYCQAAAELHGEFARFS